jgi:hypothetical protein
MHLVKSLLQFVKTKIQAVTVSLTMIAKALFVLKSNVTANQSMSVAMITLTASTEHIVICLATSLTKQLAKAINKKMKHALKIINVHLITIAGMALLALFKLTQQLAYQFIWVKKETTLDGKVYMETVQTQHLKTLG